MTIHQEAYEKIMKLPEEGVRLLLVMADEIARQHGIFSQQQEALEKDASLTRSKKAFQEMVELREKSKYPPDFDYKKVAGEAIHEKYKFSD